MKSVRYPYDIRTLYSVHRSYIGRTSVVHPPYIRRSSVRYLYGIVRYLYGIRCKLYGICTISVLYPHVRVSKRVARWTNRCGSRVGLGRRHYGATMLVSEKYMVGSFHKPE